MLLAEANQWPEDAIAYFGDPAGGPECHMAFHFPVMPRLFMAVHMEDRFPIVDILQQTPEIPGGAQWAIFLRNHDELTLEMVTDEERDYMYRVYTEDKEQRINAGIRRRLAPLLGNDRRRIELLHGLLFSLPGTPVLYYGDEIGMGDNVYLGDRNGVRTPMQWSADKNAGFSRANPQRLYLPVTVDPEYHYEAVNVETQLENRHSLLWWMRRVIALRQHHAAFRRGTLEILHPENHRVLAFLRRHEGETLLMVANLSRFSQLAALDLSALAGLTPVEMFGRSHFPEVGATPYPLTLGPHGFYWFSLEKSPVRLGRRPPSGEVAALPPSVLYARGGWDRCLEGSCRGELEEAIGHLLPGCGWFGGGAFRAVRIREALPLDDPRTLLLLVEVELLEAEEPETYALPVAFAPDAEPELQNEMLSARPPAVIARVEAAGPEGSGLLYDPQATPGFARLLLGAVEAGRRLRGERMDLVGRADAVFPELRGAGDLEPSLLGTGPSHTTWRLGDRLALKVYRRLEEGIHPELEIGRYLSERTTFHHAPRIAGSLEIVRQGPGAEPMILAVVEELIVNDGDAWRYTLDALGRYFESALTGWGHGARGPALVPREPLVELAERAQSVPPDDFEHLGTYLPIIRLLGERTADLHLALASGTGKDFAPEPFSELYQRSLFESQRKKVARTFGRLARQLDTLDPADRLKAERVLAAEGAVVDRFRRLVGRKVAAERIRTHGDYHLGQVLFTGKDFFIIDFEGEPWRSLSERRLRRSPLRDVAGMLRSLHYVVSARLIEEKEAGVVTGEEAQADLESWALYWERWVAAAFLRAYLDRADGAPFVPPSRPELALLLDVYVLDKAIYELQDELSNRPEWVGIPLQGILQVLEDAPGQPLTPRED